MVRESPAVILYDISGSAIGTVSESGIYRLQAQVTGAAPSGAAAVGNPVLIAGLNGSNVQTLKTNADGYLLADVGEISVSATNPSVSLTGSPIPTSAGFIAGTDGTNLRGIRVASDGTIRVDPTGTTTQPVSGTVTANAGTGTFAVSAASLPLPSGAATEITLATLLSETTFTNRTPTIGQKTMAGSAPVTIASDQGALAVSGTFFQATQPVSAAALPLPAGAATEATLALIKAKTDNLDVALSTRAVTGLTDTQLRASPVPVSGSFYQATQPVSGTVTANAGSGTFAISAVDLPLPSGAATEATLATRLAEATFTSRINTLGQKSMAASTPVVIASNQSAIPVTVVSGEASASNLKVAYDIGETVIYIGTAELASSTASAVWTIKRTILVDGLPTFVQWSDATAIWDDRVTESYT